MLAQDAGREGQGMAFQVRGWQRPVQGGEKMNSAYGADSAWRE